MLDQKEPEFKQVELIAVITDRNKADKIREVYKKEDINFNILFFGKGTASTEMLEFLGLDNIEKAIIISVATHEKAKYMLDKLNEKMYFKDKGSGIAFTVPISAVGGISTIQILTKTLKGEAL